MTLLTETKPAPGRVILVGTEQSAPALAAQLRAVRAPVEVLDTLIVDERARRVDRLGPMAERARARTVIVSLPSTMGLAIGRVRAEIARLGLSERFIMPIAEALGSAPAPAAGLLGGGAQSQPRLDLNQLIDRPMRALDEDRIRDLVCGRSVLITGAGGSIGAELARTCAAFDPVLLVLMERSENALFEIDRQIGERFPGVARRAVLCDVVDERRTREHVQQTSPDLIFHAAAHKHVPLMEDHPSHAVDNNVFGTKSIADAAAAAGVARFVMISTDKAVNPSSVMGATKRLAELYVNHLACRGDNGTSWKIVRFGNVIGSACSVLTIWSAQLADGGPVTVTDPRMTRYFMTIPEAAGLVAQSATIDLPGRGANLFVLDMGQPIHIQSLAERFIRAHGYEPVSDETAATSGAPAILIRHTGVRPGEKLHEELVYSAEQLKPTPCDGVRAWAWPEPEGDAAGMIARLAPMRRSATREQVLEAIRRELPEGTLRAAA